MDKSEVIWMWLIVLLLCFVATTRPTEWFAFARKYLKWTIESLKWSPYMPYLTGTSKGKGHSQDAYLNEQSKSGSQNGKSKIFPRNRRNT